MTGRIKGIPDLITKKKPCTDFLKKKKYRDLLSDWRFRKFLSCICDMRSGLPSWAPCFADYCLRADCSIFKDAEMRLFVACYGSACGSGGADSGGWGSDPCAAQCEEDVGNWACTRCCSVQASASGMEGIRKCLNSKTRAEWMECLSGLKGYTECLGKCESCCSNGKKFISCEKGCTDY